MRYFTCRSNIMEKYNKILSRMHKHLVQQKVGKNDVALLIKQFVFTKLLKFSTNSLNTHLRM